MSEDMGFRVDFTHVETKSFDPVPRGKYLLAIVDYETTEIKSGDNAGEPRVNVEFKVQEPTEIKGTKVVDRSLFEGFMPTLGTTLWRLKGFLAALGDDVSGALVFNMTEIMDREFERRLIVGKVRIQPERKNPTTGEVYDARNQISEFYPASTWKPPTAASGGGNSLLP
jgi:Protein of unknown function (DUF669)